MPTGPLSSSKPSIQQMLDQLNQAASQQTLPMVGTMVGPGTTGWPSIQHTYPMQQGPAPDYAFVAGMVQGKFEGLRTFCWRLLDDLNQQMKVTSHDGWSDPNIRRIAEITEYKYTTNPNEQQEMSL